MPLICCNCGQLLGLAFEARDRALKAVQADPKAWPGDAVVTLVMASAAAEGFINEIAELVGVTTTIRRQQGASVPPILVAFADAVAAVEKERGSTQEKYLAGARALGKPFDKGLPLYQDFATLLAIRNDLMHLKPRDRLKEGEERHAGGSPVEWPKYVVPLQRRGLARHPSSPGAAASWFELLKSEKLASWACQSAHAIMLETVNLVPDSPADPAEDMKRIVQRLGAQC